MQSETIISLSLFLDLFIKMPIRVVVSITSVQRILFFILNVKMRTEYHLAFVMFLIICKISDAAICTENGKDVCCSGYGMDKNGVCVECSPGYTGRDCVYMCQYPDYGKDCFMRCECTAEMCDHRSGCRYVSTTGKSLK